MLEGVLLKQRNFLVKALMIAWVAVLPFDGAFSAELSAALQSRLEEAATSGEDALLAAVEKAVADNPTIAEQIIAEATSLRPGLSADIQAAAVAGGGDAVVAPAAGPWSVAGPILIGGAVVGGAVAAAAAGGGSSSSSGSSSSPSAGAPSDYETTEYFYGRGLDQVNASDAYARTATGSGVVVGVVDSGVDVLHTEFAGQIAPGGYDYVLSTSTMSDPNGHGSFVAGIIAAKKDDTGVHGLAYNATILPLRVSDAGGNFVSEASIALAINRAVAQNAFVINNSWGIPTEITSLTAVAYEGSNPNLLAAFRAAVTAGKVIVFAAGNSGLNNPEGEGGLPYLFPELTSLWLTAVSVNPTGTIPTYSDRCGVAAAYCLAAPGGGDTLAEGVRSVNTGGGYAQGSGTSYAAPHVAGAVALLRQLFPSLTPAQIVQRILQTANKTGIYANTAIYGQGLLDVETATRPIGTSVILTGSTIAAPAHTLSGSTISLASAFGDGLQLSLADHQVAVFDDFRATFYADLAPMILVADNRPDLDRLVDEFANRKTASIGLSESSQLTYALRTETDTPRPIAGRDAPDQSVVESLSLTDRVGGREIAVSYNRDPALGFGLAAAGLIDDTVIASRNGFTSPYLSFAARGYSSHVAYDLGVLGSLKSGAFVGESTIDGTDRVIGTATEWVKDIGGWGFLSGQIGALTERDTVLGANSQGAFALSGYTPTAFAGISGAVHVSDDVRLVASAHAGLTRASIAGDSLFSDVSTITTNAFSIGLMGENLFRDRDRFGLLVNQPLRVTGGNAVLDLTSGRDSDGNLLHETITAGLAPRGQEIDLEMTYGIDIGDDTTVTASALLRTEPGHIDDARPEGIGLLRLQHRF